MKSKTMRNPTLRSHHLPQGIRTGFLLALLLLAGSTSAFLPTAHDIPFELPLFWPEDQRAFLQDGPGLLLSRQKLDELLDLDGPGRQRFIEDFLADPIPETPENELRMGIERRQSLVRREFLTFLDDRARLLFLHGAPRIREIVDCAGTFRPLEMWTYGSGDPSEAGTHERVLVLYQDKPGVPWDIWLPLDSKRALYNEEMEYWLDQWEELRDRISGGRRFDRQICARSEEVDRVTGVDGLFGFQEGRPKNDDLAVYLEPPDDLTAWAREAALEDYVLPEPVVVDPKDARKMGRLARKGKNPWEVVEDEEDEDGTEEAGPEENSAEEAATEEDDVAEDGADAGTGTSEEGDAEVADWVLPTTWPPAGFQNELDVYFPERDGQRLRTRLLIKIPASEPLEPFATGEKEELRLVVEGLLEQDAKIFDTFRIRYLMTPPDEGVPIALAADRSLRPGQEFLLRLRIVDEISGRTTWINRAFEVPREPTPDVDLPPVPESVITEIEKSLQKEGIVGYDSLILVPPETDVVFGLWRAEALVTGQSIEEVIFYLDDQPIMTRRRPPFTAELRLETFPTEQIVRAEGYDADGELLASDEVILNQPRGALRVRVIEPARGDAVLGSEVEARAEVVVPEEQRVAKVTFAINDEVQAELSKPPWETKVTVPKFGDLNYLTVTAELEDGQKAEDVRFLNAPENLEEVDVNLVELYTAVNDDDGFLVRGLEMSDFEVYEDDQRQEIVKFELVENLPLTLGIVLDASGSMFASMAEAQRAAVGFVENIITPRDRCFALAFSDRPVLLMPRTSDVGAVAQRLESVVANGATSLHDAIVTSLYYYRGIRGRRAMVLLSDGEDTSSTLAFKESLEYAKRSGVTIYTIGLGIGRAQGGVRNKLESLSRETGGRSFYIQEAAELEKTYAEIERELRSQYLIAYNSDQTSESGQYHEIQVKVLRRKLKARTIRGYYS